MPSKTNEKLLDSYSQKPYAIVAYYRNRLRAAIRAYLILKMFSGYRCLP